MMNKTKGVVSIAQGAVVPKDCTLEGNIFIGEGTVLHPRCKIIAEKGSINIGKGNVIEEFVTITNTQDDVMRIGNYNLIETGAQIHSRKIGDRNTIEIRAVLGEGTVVGNDCVVGMSAKLFQNEVLPDSMIVYAPHNTKRALSDTKEAHLALHARHQQLLVGTLPKFHALIRPNVAASAAAPTTPAPVSS